MIGNENLLLGGKHVHFGLKGIKRGKFPMFPFYLRFFKCMLLHTLSVNSKIIVGVILVVHFDKLIVEVNVSILSMFMKLNIHKIVAAYHSISNPIICVRCQ